MATERSEVVEPAYGARGCRCTGVRAHGQDLWWRMHDCPLHGIGTEHWKPAK